MTMQELQKETAITRSLFSRASEKKMPLSGTFELSPLCNFSCKMCYVRRTSQEVEKHFRPTMQKEQWLKIARDAREEGMLYLLLTGGEPFLWPDFWELYQELCEMGFVLSINTNGSLIDEKVLERFRQSPPNRINITLYGANDQTYKNLCNVENAFEKVDRAIEQLQEIGVEVKLNCSLTPYNEKDLSDIIQYAEDRDLVLSLNTYMFPPVRKGMEYVGKNNRLTPEEVVKYNLLRYQLQYGDEKYKEYLQKIKKGSIPPPGLDENCVDFQGGSIRCRAGNASFWITWDGWMTPCGMMPEPKIDIMDRPFSQAWSELTTISDKISISGVCDKCPNHALCHSCAAMALAETGNTQGIPQYLCQIVKAYRKYAEEFK